MKTISSSEPAAARAFQTWPRASSLESGRAPNPPSSDVSRVKGDGEDVGTRHRDEGHRRPHGAARGGAGEAGAGGSFVARCAKGGRARAAAASRHHTSEEAG